MWPASAAASAAPTSRLARLARAGLRRAASSRALAAAECACREIARLAACSSEAAICSSGPLAARAACHVDESELLAPTRAAWAERRSERSAPYTTVERTSGCGQEKRPSEIGTSADSWAGLSSERLKLAEDRMSTRRNSSKLDKSYAG